LNTGIIIVDKLDNYTIKINTDLAVGLNDELTTGSIFNITTPITAMRYYWNFLENTSSNDYFSKVDNSLQLLFNNSISTGNTTPAPMLFSGNKPYQIGSATISGDGVNTTIIYGQKFIVIHETFVTPFILATQVTDLESGVNPSYFLNGQALKDISKFEAMYNFNDPNRILTYQSSVDINNNLVGNSGGYGENFNTGITNYSIGQIVYANIDGVTDTLQLTTDETTIEIVVNNTTDTPFSNNNTEFTLGFIKVPFDVTEYQGNTRTMAENFCFDRAHNTVGSAAVNGDTYGTDYQVLKNVEASFTNSGSITISANVLCDANVLSIIQESDVYKYLLFVSVQDHTKTSLASNCDRVTLIADLNTFYVDSTDVGLVVAANTFIEHPYTDEDIEATPKLDAHVEDEVCAQSIFYVDKNGREDDEIVITSISCKIKAINGTNDDEFTLDSYTLSMANMPVINDNQYVDVTTPRVFHIEESIRKNIKVIRRTDLDDTGKYYYQVLFPFMVRWEYWLALQGVNGNFFDTAEGQNGFNNEWFRYANGQVDDWRTWYDFTVNVTKNGTPMSYSETSVFSITDYNVLGGDYIKTYDSQFATELYNAVSDRWYIQTTDNTGLEAVFTMDSGYQLGGCFVAFHIQTKEGSGVSEFRRYSSVNVQSSDTYFDSTTGNDLIYLAKPR